MTDSADDLSYMREPRLSAHALAPAPAWLWSADGTRLLWLNAAAAALFDAAPSAAEAAAKEIARIAPALPPKGASRLERLNGVEPSRPLTCGCSCISLDDGSAAILVVAAEAAGPLLSLEDRVQRLVAGLKTPAAVFAPDGSLFHAGDPKFAGATLEAIDADALALHALRTGFASGTSKLGVVSFERVGADPATFLIATLPGAQRATPQAAPAAPPPELRTEEAAVDVSPQSATDENALEERAEPPATETLAPELPAAEAAPETATPEASPVEASAAPSPDPLYERRHPLRFIWHMNGSEHFTIDSGDFLRLAGANTAEIQGLPWGDVAQRLGIDPQGDVAKAVAMRDTWSGITLDWPVEGTDEKLTVELSGLPIFSPERAFGGYRGFGICRDARKISHAMTLREAPPAALQGNEAAGEPQQETARDDESSQQTAEPEEQKPRIDERPQLTIVPQAENVVPFRAANNEKAPTLTTVERSTFQEIAKELTNRLQQEGDPAEAELPQDTAPEASKESGQPTFGFIPKRESASRPPDLSQDLSGDHTILDRVATGILVYRLDAPLYANPAFLEWSGYSTATALTAAGGLDVLFVEPLDQSADAGWQGQPLRVTSNRGKQRTAEGRLFTAPWEGDPAHVLMLLPEAVPAKAAAEPVADTSALETETRELRTILDTATDGILLLDNEGRITGANAGAENLFGRDSRALIASSLTDLIAPESHPVTLEYLAEAARSQATSKTGREVIGRAREGGLLPLQITLGRFETNRFYATLRDLTAWKKTEMELVTARRQAEKASSAKSEFLAKISHEIRTPLNSIIGFSEVMMSERFGPIGNERYTEYLKDINASGTHLLSLLNDLLDLSKIEAGKMDLIFGRVSLNDVTQQCVSLMQPQANQERVIIRTSLPKVLPPVIADARSLRQIVLNLLSNSIKFTGAGGQVIISTGQTDDGDVVLRVRDTGHGMTEKEIQMALEPFRQLATSSRLGSGGTGLGLPLTKALAEANRANFSIKSMVNVGTLVEVAFPPNRVLVA